MKARLSLFMGAIALFGAAGVSAGPLSVEPRLGASADYESNPGLREFATTSEKHIAALFYVPIRYDTGDLELELTPNGRLSNSRGYASLGSTYLHLDANARLINELGSTSIQAELARDSSLYHAGEIVNAVGVRRDTNMTAIDWTHSLSARDQVQFDSSWTNVRYQQPPATTHLVDYRYLTAGPTFAFAVNERNTLRLSGSYGNYQSISGLSASKSANVQLGFQRQLSELWSLSASAGYSRATNSQKYFFGGPYVGTVMFNQNGAVYSVNVIRQGETVRLSGGISRALQPTGLPYLAKQDSVNLDAAYPLSERWDFTFGAVWQKAINPAVRGAETETRYSNVIATLNWHFTPQWTVSLHATRIEQRVGPPTVSARSSGVSVDVVRQFLRTAF